MPLKNTWLPGESFTAADVNEIADAVNGNTTGVAGKADSARTVTAGTGLTGGGDLTANRTLAADFGTGAGKVCEGDDARLSDARTPTAHNHAASNITSGTLAIARIPTGTTSSTVCIGNDTRLSDARPALGPTVQSVTSSATPTPAISSASHQYNVTALAANATFGAPTGSPVDGGTLMLRVKDNGTARNLAFNAAFRALGVTLPTTTTANKTLYIGCRYNSADSKWDVLAVGLEA